MNNKEVFQPNFFLILGMHRSGTSCLTGVLKRCGVYLGKVNLKNKFNAKGNHENKEVRAIHDQILALNKRSWFNPPEDEIFVQNYHREKIKNIVEQLQCNSPCALKDPRTLLVLDLWKSLNSPIFQFIGTFRHPARVAQSLHYRNGIPLEQGMLIWLNYNRRLVAEHQKTPFPLIHYHMGDKKKYKQSIYELAELFNLRPNKLKINFFIKSSLEHHKETDFPISEECRNIYNYLLNHQL